jgi:GcrA cell cycle regulator
MANHLYGSHWTEERTAELKRLVAAQLSASEIAKAMGDGLTRNSIIGRCHRLGLELGGARQVFARQPKATPKPLKTSKAARLFVGSWGACPEIIPGHVPPTPVADLVPLNIPLADIGAFQCRWVTSQEPALFCGHRAEVGSWCPTHRAIVFTPRTEKRGARVLEAA